MARTASRVQSRRKSAFTPGPRSEPAFGASLERVFEISDTGLIVLFQPLTVSTKITDFASRNCTRSVQIINATVCDRERNVFSREGAGKNVITHSGRSGNLSAGPPNSGPGRQAVLHHRSYIISSTRPAKTF